MKEKTTKSLYLTLLIFYVVLFVIGTFFDLKISNTLYQKDANISLVMATFHYCLEGGVFSLILGSIFGYGFHKLDNNKTWNIICVIFGIVGVLVLSFFNQLVMFSSNSIFYYYNPNFSLNFVIKYLIGFIIILIPAIFGFIFLYKYFNRKKIYLFLFLLGCLLIPFSITTMIKEIWPRPKYRFVLTMDSSLFYPWYKHIPRDIVKYYLNLGVLKEQFRSFPSGHSTVGVVFMITIPFLKNFFENIKIKEWLLLSIGFLYAIFMQFTRINCGAHYLSDVSMAAINTLVIDGLLLKFVYPKIK